LQKNGWTGATERLEDWLRATLAADLLVPGGSISRLTFWYQQLQGAAAIVKTARTDITPKLRDGSPMSKVVILVLLVTLLILM
jgi:hypothetical protein